MGLFDKVYEKRGEPVPEHFKNPVKDLREKRLKQTSKMSFKKLREHIAKKMDSSSMEHIKQSRINNAIKHIK